MNEQQAIIFNKMCRDIGLSEADLQKRLQKSSIKEETFILWTEYNKQANELAKTHQWDSFRYIRKKMHEFLLFEGKDMPALIMLFQVIHLDLNGPQNIMIGKDSKPDLSQETPFDLKSSSLTTPLVKDVINLNKKLNLSIEQLKEIYLDTIVKIKIQPLEVSDTWERLEGELKELM